MQLNGEALVITCKKDYGEEVLSDLAEISTRMKNGKVSDLLISTNDPAATDVSLVGNKFYGIARLKARGFLVPDSFAIPAPIVSKIITVSEESTIILGDIIDAAKSSLHLDQGVAVRSSSLYEDQMKHSGAGKFLSILEIKTVADLKNAIIKVAQHALRLSDDAQLHGLSIVLQQMIHPSIAGVVFSRHPFFTNKDILVVEAVPGLGDKLVSGEAVPTRIIVDSVNSIKINGEPLIDQSTLVRIKNDARRIESEWGCPMDMEFAIQDNQLFFLQARPITTVSEERPGGVWTRAIVEDLWGDRLCRLDESIIKGLAPRFNFTKYLKKMGMASETKTTVEAIDGYLYLNADVFRTPVLHLPKGIPVDALNTIFPPGRLPTPEGKWFPFAIKALWLLISHPEMNPFFCDLISRKKALAILRKAKNNGKQAQEIDGVIANVERLISSLADLLEQNQAPYFFAFLFTWLTEYLSKGKAWDAMSVLSGCKKNPTYEMNLRLIELGKVLQEAGAAEKANQLLDTFLKDYGFRSESRSLAQPRWQEEPELVKHVALSVSQSSAMNVKQNATIPVSILPIVWMGRRYLELREELRNVLDQLLFEMRNDFNRLDRMLQLEGTIYSLTVDEIISYGRSGKVGKPDRHRVNEANNVTSRTYPPRFYVDGESFDYGQKSGVLEGIPTSQGRVRGRARVVRTFEDAITANRDDILIARTMGPSWTIILTKISGVILSEGSTLDHFSIIARELGVPCIVGAGDRVLHIKDGTSIEIDGYEGKISIV